MVLSQLSYRPIFLTLHVPKDQGHAETREGKSIAPAAGRSRSAVAAGFADAGAGRVEVELRPPWQQVGERPVAEELGP